MFLKKLQSYAALPSNLIFHMATLYGLSTTPNAEIRLRFYGLALQDPGSAAAQAFAQQAADWIIGDDGTGVIKGRMKFCRPVFRDVYKADKELAVQKFLKAKMSFHPIARKLIEKVRNSNHCKSISLIAWQIGSEISVGNQGLEDQQKSVCNVSSLNMIE